MGSKLNASGDLVPPEAMYDACRIFAAYVEYQDNLSWDFRRALDADIPEEFRDRIHAYLASVLRDKSVHKGWKIPETTLCYPWIVRMFPEAKYIFWIRDPRDAILASHVTDDLGRFNVRYPVTDDVRLRRAISWKYQYDLVKATPKPRHWLELRFEDFVLNQEETLARIEDFLEMRLARIIVRPDAVGRWKHDTGTHYFDFFAGAMKAYGYE
jgi:hypothetical protein